MDKKGRWRIPVVMGALLSSLALALAFAPDAKREDKATTAPPALPIAEKPVPENLQKEFVGPLEPENTVRKVRQVATSNDMVLLARTDLFRLPEEDRVFMRYFMIRYGGLNSLRTLNLVLNYVTRASSIKYSTPIAGGRLARIDLRDWAPRDVDLVDWIRAFEDFAFDSQTALLITKDTIKFLSEEQKALLPQTFTKKVKLVKVPGEVRIEERVLTVTELPFTSPDGKVYTREVYPKLQIGKQYTFELQVKSEFVEKQTVIEETLNTIDAGKANVIRLDPDQYIDIGALHDLQEATHSQAPIIDHLYFKSRAMKTLKDDGLQADVWGGRYFELVGIKKAKDVLGKDTKASDLDLFFEKNIGIGNIKGGVTADVLFEGLGSDERSILFQSAITGNARSGDLFNVPSAKRGSAKGAITGDLKVKSVDVGQRPFFNILKPFRDGREGIFPRPTGLDIFIIVNGDGNLVESVPEDIAANHMIPAPHHKRLEAAIGCIWCHQVEGSDGWKPMGNDIRTLLNARQIDFFRDLSSLKSASEDVDRAFGLFSGNFDSDLQANRDRVVQATMRATWLETMQPQAWPTKDMRLVSKEASQWLVDEFSDFNYTKVDAKRALRDLGFDVPENKANEFFRLILPAQFDERIGKFVPEDIRIAAIRGGISILPSDWQLAFPFAAGRVRKNFAVIPKGVLDKWLEN